MPTLHAMMGLPGSGKSWFADNLYQHNTETSNIICPDDWRRAMTGDINDQSKNNEVFAGCHERAREKLLIGNDVIFDATNVSQRARDELLAIAKETGATTHLHVIDTPVDVCRARMEARGRVVPSDSFNKMVGQYAALIANAGGFFQMAISEEAWDHITIHSTKEIR